MKTLKLGRIIENAVFNVLKRKELTIELSGKLTTSEMTNLIINEAKCLLEQCQILNHN